VPGRVVRLLLVGLLAATFPYAQGTASFLGLRLSNWLTIWAANCMLVVVAVFIATVAFFLVRAMVAYLEEGRWPKRAAGIDMSEMDMALDQVDQRSRDLSEGADQIRVLERHLRRSEELIRYLWSELDRARGSEARPADHTEQRRVHADE